MSHAPVALDRLVPYPESGGARLKTISLALLLLCWIAWWYPFLFRAPHFQKRPSITVPWPTRTGLLLEISAFAVSFVFHLPVLQRAGERVSRGGDGVPGGGASGQPVPLARRSL